MRGDRPRATAPLPGRASHSDIPRGGMLLVGFARHTVGTSPVRGSASEPGILLVLPPRLVGPGAKPFNLLQEPTGALSGEQIAASLWMSKEQDRSDRQKSVRFAPCWIGSRICMILIQNGSSQMQPTGQAQCSDGSWVATSNPTFPCCPKADARKITREEYEDARQVARDIAATKQYAILMRLRKKVEMLFAHLKRILGLGRLRLRGPSRDHGYAMNLPGSACGANEVRFGLARPHWGQAPGSLLLAAIAQNLRKLAKTFPAPQRTLKA